MPPRPAAAVKDPLLELALSRDRRWIVNNQIKNLLLRSPSATLPVTALQRRFNSLDLQGRALNWLRKYPSCFHVINDNPSLLSFTLSPRLSQLIADESQIISSSVPAMARRLAKLLMLSRRRRLNVVKINQLKRVLGFPDDYILRILPGHADTFSVVNYPGRRVNTVVQLIRWDPELAVSAVQESAEARFNFSLPGSGSSFWVKARDRFDSFNRTPYISPYDVDSQEVSEKRAVGVVHELLSLTLWKKASVAKLGHLRRELGLPEKLGEMLRRHVGIFYVSQRYGTETVVLRDGYKGSELVEKDPVVVVKEKFGELMQEGVKESNRRGREVVMERRRERGGSVRPTREVKGEGDGDDKAELERMEKREERKRFYKALFDDNE